MSETLTAQVARVFVAATPAEWLPTRVLHFSIHEHASTPVELTPLWELKRPIPIPRDLDHRPRTPFSFQRFLIPEACQFEGRAIYLDSDMQVFHDIAELWDTPLNGCTLQTTVEGNDGRRGQFSVMLLDCARLGWNVDDIVARLDEGSLTYHALMYDMCLAPSIGREISAHWNSLERYLPGQTRLLHYTDMNTQPWVSSANPLGALWIACLRRAVSAGFITPDELAREIDQGHVRPSLAAQLDSGEDDPRRLGPAARALDRNFVAPYRSIRAGRGSPWVSARHAALAWARQLRARFHLGGNA